MVRYYKVVENRRKRINSKISEYEAAILEDLLIDTNV